MPFPGPVVEAAPEALAAAVPLTAAFRPKVIYVAHPFASDPEGNKARAATACREIMLARPGVVPVCPILAFSFLEEPREREAALAFCLALLERCDELWLAGDWELSEGCRLERRRALELGMPVYRWPEDAEA